MGHFERDEHAQHVSATVPGGADAGRANAPVPTRSLAGFTMPPASARTSHGGTRKLLGTAARCLRPMAAHPHSPLPHLKPQVQRCHRLARRLHPQLAIFFGATIGVVGQRVHLHHMLGRSQFLL